MGKLYFKYGTMNSGKSSHLLIQAHSLEDQGQPVLCMKPSIDTRDDANVVSARVGLERECVSIEPELDIYSYMEEYFINLRLQLIPAPKWILVDEAQFLEPEQVDQLGMVVDNFDVSVVCFGLRTDFQSMLFPGSKRLFEISDDIDEIKMSCSCGKKAVVNARIDDNGNVVVDGDQVVIGGNERYRSMCRKCFFHKVEKTIENSRKQQENMQV